MQARIYKAGSVIYFVGDKAETVFILKQGQAQSIYESIETGFETRDKIVIGEFFGVKSVFGGYPQEETVQCLTDCSVILLTPAEFEALISKNIPVLLKMLKVFSNQLRRIGKKVRSVTDSDINIDPKNEIFKIGEFYFKDKKYKQALYAYEKYIEYAGEDAPLYASAKDKIIESKTALDLDVSSDMADLHSSDAFKNALPVLDDTGFDLDANLPKIDDSLPNLETESKSPYDKAVDKYKAGNYEAAASDFKKISLDNTTKAEEASFELGKCYFMLEKYNETLNSMLAAIKKYPKSLRVKEAMLFAGKANQGIGDKEKAKAFYKRIVSMNVNDSVTKEASSLLAKL